MKFRILMVLPLVTITAIGCGGETGKVSTASGSTSTTKSSPTTTIKEVCPASEGSKKSPEEVIESLPAVHRQVARKMIKLTGAFSGNAADPASSAASFQELTEMLASNGFADDLHAFAEWEAKVCGPSEAVTAARAFAESASLASSPKVPEYCAALGKMLTLENGGLIWLMTQKEIAPPAHAKALLKLADLIGGDANRDETLTATIGLVGFGAYAEKQCGIEGATIQIFSSLTPS